MPFDPANFWSSSSARPPVADAELVGAEQRLQVRLPPEYVALLKLQNGGYTQGFGHPMAVPTSWADNHVPLESLAGIGVVTGATWRPDILDSDYLTKEWGLPPRQVLLAGDGHWWITLDYRSGATPSVRWLDVEVGEDLLVAPLFGEFIAGLRPIAEFD